MWDKFFSKTLFALLGIPFYTFSAPTESTDLSDSTEIHKMIRQAEDLYEACLFNDAIPHYQNILQSIAYGTFSFTIEKPLVEQIDSQIRFRLAQALFQVKDYQSAVAILQNHSMDVDHHFLLGTAYRNNGEYSQAIVTLKNYLLQEPQDNLPHRDEALLELGISLYLNEQLSEAQVALENASKSSKSLRIGLLASLYLARIEAAQNHFSEAERYLDEAKKKLKENDVLKYEISFLKGEIAFRKHQFLLAAGHFENALPPNNQSYAKWHEDTLYYLGISYLRLAESPNIPNEKRLTYYTKSEKNLLKLVELKPKDRSWLALGDYYLSRANMLEEIPSFKKAEEVFGDISKFSLPESQNLALLLKAQSQVSYIARDTLFRQLTQQSNVETTLRAKAWYLRGLNDFKEAQFLEKNEKSEDAQKMYERAIASLENAHDQLLDHHEYNALAILLQGRAYFSQSTNINHVKAENILNQLWDSNAKLLHALPDPLEAHILYAQNTAQLSDAALTSVISKLQEGLTAFPSSPHRPDALNLLGTLYFKNQQYAAAENVFQLLAREWPHSSFAPEALFWASQSAEKQQKDRLIVRKYRQQIIEQFPNSSIAPEAAFSLYTYQEYLQGDRSALKHLNALTETYPENPLTLNALFLIGLDNKRDRRSSEGKWIRKKNLSASIDYFQQLESLFDTLNEKKLISSDKLEHYLLVRSRAHLERGLANYLLSQDSTGAKKQIYLEFAQDTLKQLLQELESEDNLYKKWIVNGEAFWHIQEETAYWLTQSYIAAQEFDMAEQLLAKMLEKYRTAKITRGYFLSKVWSTQGTIALNKKEYTVALECLLRAEDAAKGKVLTTDQRLDLWIQQSECYRELNNFDKALLILSKAVNDDAVSGLRIKAMFLRAGIYEKQERFELARKQLEATAKKGGEWASKAKEKLEKDYGYK